MNHTGHTCVIAVNFKCIIVTSPVGLEMSPGFVIVLDAPFPISFYYYWKTFIVFQVRGVPE